MIAIHALGERDRALPLCLASLTAALVLLFGAPSALALSPSPTPSATPTTWATLTSTGTPATTPTATGTAWLTPTATSTFELTLINLEMPAHIFSEGDTCSLVLNIINLGNERKVDLYVLLDVFGDYYCYPSWCHYQEEGLDCRPLTIERGYQGTETIIAEFVMPEVSAGGPFYFYAAFFDQGYLGLSYLASNGTTWDFSLQ